VNDRAVADPSDPVGGEEQQRGRALHLRGPGDLVVERPPHAPRREQHRPRQHHRDGDDHRGRSRERAAVLAASHQPRDRHRRHHDGEALRHHRQPEERKAECGAPGQDPHQGGEHEGRRHQVEVTAGDRSHKEGAGGHGEGGAAPVAIAQSRGRPRERHAEAPEGERNQPERKRVRADLEDGREGEDGDRERRILEVDIPVGPLSLHPVRRPRGEVGHVEAVRIRERRHDVSREPSHDKQEQRAPQPSTRPDEPGHSTRSMAGSGRSPRYSTQARLTHG
jgi:hypothetical protein